MNFPPLQFPVELPGPPQRGAPSSDDGARSKGGKRRILHLLVNNGFLLFFVKKTLKFNWETVSRPKSEMDYGSLRCWGANAVGEQREKCGFVITQTSKNFSNTRHFQEEILNAIFLFPGRPHPLQDCTIRNQTSSSRSPPSNNDLEVSCRQAYSGGLKQLFVLEVLTFPTKDIFIFLFLK